MWSVVWLKSTEESVELSGFVDGILFLGQMSSYAPHRGVDLANGEAAAPGLIFS
jgi:hypothetical protein